MKRGILTIEALKARCTVVPDTGCWLWQGACSGTPPTPRIWTLDYGRAEKRTMSGPLAAWHIAYEAPPRPGRLVYRGCMSSLCLNPWHLREASTKAEIGLHIRRTGIRVGTALESRRANVRLAQAASGVVQTPDDVVLAIRAAPPGVTNKALCELHGVNRTVVSRIRRGESHRQVL